MEFQNVRQIAPTTYTFTLTPTHVTYANTLRRLMMTGVETVAFRADMTSTGTTTDVMIRENTTPMTNEMLAHRIGLLPIAVSEPMKWNADRGGFAKQGLLIPAAVVQALAAVGIDQQVESIGGVALVQLVGPPHAFRIPGRHDHHGYVWCLTANRLPGLLPVQCLGAISDCRLEVAWNSR